MISHDKAELKIAYLNALRAVAVLFFAAGVSCSAVVDTVGRVVSVTLVEMMGAMRRPTVAAVFMAGMVAIGQSGELVPIVRTQSRADL